MSVFILVPRFDQFARSEITEQELRAFAQEFEVPILRIRNINGPRLPDGQGLDGRASLLVSFCEFFFSLEAKILCLIQFEKKFFQLGGVGGRGGGGGAMDGFEDIIVIQSVHVLLQPMNSLPLPQQYFRLSMLKLFSDPRIVQLFESLTLQWAICAMMLC